MRDFTVQKAALDARLESLEKRVHTIDEQLGQPASKDWDDQAIESEDTEVLEQMGESGLREIEAIRAALGRIESGTYGICLRCGDDIAMSRLEAVPTALLCQPCASGRKA